VREGEREENSPLVIVIVNDSGIRDQPRRQEYQAEEDHRCLRDPRIDTLQRNGTGATGSFQRERERGRGRKVGGDRGWIGASVDRDGARACLSVRLTWLTSFASVRRKARNRLTEGEMSSGKRADRRDRQPGMRRRVAARDSEARE